MAKILLVEDDIDLSIIVRDGLDAHDHEVEHAANGPDARAKLLGDKYDLIIMDWELPGATGPELIREFRSAGGLTPVVMLTGKNTLEDKESGLDSGADDYLTKPFAIRELSARVKSLLRRSTAYVPEQPKLPPGQLAPGVVLGDKYKLEEVIGQGGMATIWKATHTGMPKPVVIKVLQPQLASRDAALKRFEQECRAMAKLSHPNVVAVTDVDLVNTAQPYLVLEYIKGESLRQIIYDQGQLPVWLALEIVMQICDGLGEAHGAGIVHRDLKPDNILIQERTDRPDWVKIVDFGIAQLSDSTEKLTEEGMIVGTVEYISPEQLQDNVIDGRADIYALGIILYEMLAGKLPFEAKTPHAVLMKKLMGEPEKISDSRIDISDDSPVAQIIAKALEKDRQKRYQSTAELRADAEKVLWQQNH